MSSKPQINPGKIFPLPTFELPEILSEEHKLEHYPALVYRGSFYNLIFKYNSNFDGKLELCIGGDVKLEEIERQPDKDDVINWSVETTSTVFLVKGGEVDIFSSRSRLRGAAANQNIGLEDSLLDSVFLPLEERLTDLYREAT